MKNNRLQSVQPYPESQERVQPRSHSLGRWRFLPWLICYGFLLLGLSPGVALAGGEKVALCHVPPGDPTHPQTLTVAPSAVPAHLKNHPDDHLGPCCQTDSQCDDANPCTMDTCTSAGACEHTPVTCTSGDACNDDVCIPAEGGCIAVPKKAGTVCDDSNACTASDVCDGAGECVGKSIKGCCLSDADCNDSNACTADVCEPTKHVCINTKNPPTPTPCEELVCDPKTGWSTTPRICPVDVGDICHIAVCDPNIPMTGACVTQPNPTNPCQNGGTCGDGPTCTCPAGYTGTHCETVVDPCTPNPCQNGGTCSNQTLDLCTCPAGYTGIYCETVVDPCTPNPCQNGGTCSNQTLDLCTCPAGYTGIYCETVVEPST